MALALGATLVARSATGERRVRADDFFQGPFATALAPDELLCEVRFPFGRAGGHSILECARTHGNFAIAGAVCSARLDEARRLRDVAIVVFGACSRPTRVDAAAGLLEGEGATAELVAEAAACAADEIETIGDIHGSSSYRRRLARVYVERSLAAAIGRATEEAE